MTFSYKIVWIRKTKKEFENVGNRAELNFRKQLLERSLRKIVALVSHNNKRPLPAWGDNPTRIVLPVDEVVGTVGAEDEVVRCVSHGVALGS